MQAMRKLIVTLFVTTALPLFAQVAKPARVLKKPEPTEATAPPTPAPRRSILDRLFNNPKPTPEPTPTPAPPKPKPRPFKPKATETPEETPAEKPIEQPAKPPVEPTTEKPAPPVPAPPEPAAEAPKLAKGKSPKPVAVKMAKPDKPDKPDLSNLDEPAKFKAVKALALQDSALLELRGKADSTLDADDAKRASLEYNRALFRKIREIEPSLNTYVDRLEQAVLKRVK